WCLVSDESICALARLCPKLEQLYLEGCNITDVSMSTLANLRNLQKLDIEKCEKISVNAIISLQNKIPTLNIIGWYSDSNDDLNKIKEKGMPIFVYNIDETSKKSSERMKGNKFSPDAPFKLL
ncbi:18006_t:CDS:2, partial [Dentiscutata erythropus]